ncbi:MAG: serine/threonine-protein phosphatase [Chloroflexi bacterium]|jgi:serine phosphatase RsbU (regulator of sigma subunit)|nr:serine/threonine-protein phosphatase [Chloroflexota bacterium]MBT3669934.1 serine/threonine-protein phosphatase [Chloroflexota bacterium]MBT4001865.1 serine/threonine-protein phosphatase [Chloroflexota bacterium]MBT4304836.1 serine/threonine-protein phosphatase [Chloroflexota bacterium]MBT4534663.1 serine/threonine-protein phosphatase [Chloroflexota bacterium]
MEIQIGVAKINKYASSESGDTLEIIERPAGGLSVVLADGQRSGKSAKRISNIVVRKVISLLAEGVRDGAAARAASDYLFSHRSGKVQSTLNILSIDLETNTLVISRNNPIPMILGNGKSIQLLDEESKPVGVYRNTKPVITELNLEKGLTVIAFSDGLTDAGLRQTRNLDLESIVSGLLADDKSAQEIADHLMDSALEVDQGRPIDDTSIVVLRVVPFENDWVRRMSVRFPLKK